MGEFLSQNPRLYKKLTVKPRGALFEASFIKNDKEREVLFTFASVNSRDISGTFENMITQARRAQTASPMIVNAVLTQGHEVVFSLDAPDHQPLVALHEETDPVVAKLSYIGGEADSLFVYGENSKGEATNESESMELFRFALFSWPQRFQSTKVTVTRKDRTTGDNVYIEIPIGNILL